MSEHIQDSIPTPNPDQEPAENGTPKTGRLRKLGKNSLKVAKPLGAVLVVGALATVWKANSWNQKVGKYENNEQLMLKFQSSKGLQCLNKAVLLHGGVVYRNTPQSLAKDPLGPLTRNTIAGEISSTEEALVKRSVIYKDDNKTTWLGFTLNHNQDRGQHSSKIDLEAISKDLVWVNYSKLSSTFDSNRKPLAAEFDLTHSPEKAADTDCHVIAGGLALSNNKPAAFLVGKFQEGAIQQINQGMDDRY